MTPIQSKVNELEKEYQELGYNLHISLWELKTMIREYAEVNGLGSYNIQGRTQN